MTGTNRNRKLCLDAGWQHYWFVLFPGGIDWRSDLETEIRQHLYSPGYYKVFQKAGHLKGEPPVWAANLELQVQKASVTVTFSNVEFGKFPLFLDQLIPVLSNWNGRNPFDKTAGQSDLTDKEQRECRNLVPHCAMRTIATAGSRDAPPLRRPSPPPHTSPRQSRHARLPSAAPACAAQIHHHRQASKTSIAQWGQHKQIMMGQDTMGRTNRLHITSTERYTYAQHFVFFKPAVRQNQINLARIARLKFQQALSQGRSALRLKEFHRVGRHQV